MLQLLHVLHFEPRSDHIEEVLGKVKEHKWCALNKLQVNHVVGRVLAHLALSMLLFL